MSPIELLLQAKRSGVVFELVGKDEVDVIGNPEEVDIWLPLLREHKKEIARLLAPTDDRRRCQECGNLRGDGRCLAAARSELKGVAATYYPVRQIPRRCEGFTARTEQSEQSIVRETPCTLH